MEYSEIVGLFRSALLRPTSPRDFFSVNQQYLALVSPCLIVHTVRSFQEEDLKSLERSEITKE